MDNEQESQELDRAYQEYAQVKEAAERAAYEQTQQMAMQIESTMRMFNHFLSKIL